MEQQHFLAAIISLRRQLDVSKTGPTELLQRFDRFENQLTLDELEVCLQSSPDERTANITHLLAHRWERLRNTGLCYTQQPDNPVNQLCLSLARAIAPPATTESEIDSLAPNTGPYFLLMPSLEKSEDVYGQNIHRLGLDEMVLSDGERRFIPIEQCLYQASISDEGDLRHMVMLDDEPLWLSPREIERITKHSSQAVSCYEALSVLNQQRILGDDIGAKLTKLVSALRQGGAYGRGSEMDAAAAANEGIFEFHGYWEGLAEKQRKAILKETPRLEELLGRLFRPADKDYTDLTFCVVLIASCLDSFIAFYNTKPKIRTLEAEQQTQAQAFKTAVDKRALKRIRNTTPPNNILHLIFQLSAKKQTEFFQGTYYANALMYALAYAPEAIPLFVLDDAAKQLSIAMRTIVSGDPALFVAAKKGARQTLELLLRWGADIHAQDWHKRTALHWAASNGQVEAVECLLEHGASLESKGEGSNTALHLAVQNGHAAVVEILLKQNGNLSVRNGSAETALDLAEKHHPELVASILKQLATRPLEEQTACFSKVSTDAPNVLWYATARYPQLFDTLVTTVLEQTNPESRRVVQAVGSLGLTSLMFAARLGSQESVRALLTAGLDTESRDNLNNTALHHAAFCGHVGAVNCLLEHGALIEAEGADKLTALHVAVSQKQKEVVALLLQKKANVNARESNGKNALDIAIRCNHPQLVCSILLHMTTLPVEEQMECLLNVPTGPFKDAYSFVLDSSSDVFTGFLRHVTYGDPLDATMTLLNARFDQHLQSIQAHYQVMKKKSESNGKYVNAALAAETLLRECIDAKIQLHRGEGSFDTRMLAFQTTCKRAIATARDVLERHRNWPKLLVGLLLAVVTFPVSIPLYAMGFFSLSTKTKSEQLLNTLDKAIPDTLPPACVAASA